VTLPATGSSYASPQPGQGAPRFQALIRPFGITAISAVRAAVFPTEETGATFEENAALKAQAAAGGLAVDGAAMIPRRSFGASRRS